MSQPCKGAGGLQGMVVERHNDWFRAPVKRHTTASEFNIDTIGSLPQVDIVYARGNVQPTAVQVLVASGANTQTLQRMFWEY